jgi:alkylhydroperoxidase/carboxymuconolactone decarboxylase family protein YurZ
MQDLRAHLSDDRLASLRDHYDRAAMLRAASSPCAVLYPPLDPWMQQTAATIYERSSLAPRDRERCIIAVLISGGALPTSLAIHFYWGLMEGLSADDVCQTIGIVGAYGGMQRAAFGLAMLQRVLTMLDNSVTNGELGSTAIVGRFIAELR